MVFRLLRVVSFVFKWFSTPVSIVSRRFDTRVLVFFVLPRGLFFSRL